ncbi:recombinase family protein [Dermabacter sp. HSID17554]|uniref:recombinase family protein n=1 Tax=Dermabacter sp. HSID17554 TaxID=2419511 RepID=UPI000F8646E6|nr:recombinase family protein [Dermabacter sp. HSID17554]RUP87491.1 hypothetical protein D8M36_02665 [Dermabacter sp. HSID17554]
MKPMTLYAATVTGVQSNTIYPHRHTITTETDLKAVAGFDHVAATYTANKRSTTGFITSDCVVMDIDNGHSDSPAEWITPERLAEVMDGVGFMTATSRNHHTPKGSLSARPRFHVYFPINPVSDAAVYAGLKQTLAARFPFFDSNAVDAGRFIYGNPTTTIEIFDRDGLLDEWLDAADDLDVFAAWDEVTQLIGEGSRNATLSKFAGRILVRLGKTEAARQAFDYKAAQCDPPLSAWEVERIWASACRFATKVTSQPGYLPGVEVYFEKENIYTFDSKGELLITIMSSLAQEESRSISENVTWGHRRRFAEGKALISYKNLLGYTKNSDGDLVIDETEAPIVRRIYANYLAGHTPSQSAADLTRDEVPTPQGKQVWSVSTINSILRNEKYKGDVLIQKTFTIDFLTKKTKKNEGEVPQYYVSGHHEPIVDPAVWERVQ